MGRIVRNLFRHRSLILTLTQRELMARYRGSVLGFLWSLVNPLLLLVVYSFAFTVIFQPRDPSVSNYGPYALFLATGVIPWIWLSTSWLEGTNSLLANAGLIRKAAFPAETLPVVVVLANLVHLALAVPILAAGFGVAWLLDIKVTMTWSALLFPLVILLHLPMVCGMTFATAALNVHFKDVRDILQNLLTFLFFATPILYTMGSLAAHPPVYWAVAANPLTPFFRAYQECLFFGRVPAAWMWLAMASISALCFVVGAWVFDRLSETLVEAV